jgi:hypothetical protein
MSGPLRADVKTIEFLTFLISSEHYMNSDNKIQSRRRFIAFGAVATLSFALFRFFIPHKPEKPKTTKMLTQDGKLVEVELTKLPVKRKRISDGDIHTWVKRKSI